MTPKQQLEHRLLMIADDMKVIRNFIQKHNLDDAFKQPTKEADECWTHLNNIDVACDLSDDASLFWKPFNNK